MYAEVKTELQFLFSSLLTYDIDKKGCSLRIMTSLIMTPIKAVFNLQNKTEIPTHVYTLRMS